MQELHYWKVNYIIVPSQSSLHKCQWRVSEGQNSWFCDRQYVCNAHDLVAGYSLSPGGGRQLYCGRQDHRTGRTFWSTRCERGSNSVVSAHRPAYLTTPHVVYGSVFVFITVTDTWHLTLWDCWEVNGSIHLLYIRACSYHGSAVWMNVLTRVIAN